MIVLFKKITADSSHIGKLCCKNSKAFESFCQSSFRLNTEIAFYFKPFNPISLVSIFERNRISTCQSLLKNVIKIFVKQTNTKKKKYLHK